MIGLSFDFASTTTATIAAKIVTTTDNTAADKSSKWFYMNFEYSLTIPELEVRLGFCFCRGGSAPGCCYGIIDL